MHGSPCPPNCSPLPPRHTHVMLPRYVASVLWVWCRGRGAATHGGGGRNPAAATTPPPWVRGKKKKRRGSCEMGLSRLFFGMGEHGVLGTPSQMRGYVDHNLISQQQPPVWGGGGWIVADCGLPSQCFQKISSKLKTNVLLPSDLWVSSESEWSR